MLKVIVFDVEHGSCAFIKTPSGHGIMIDCGRKGSFSPAKYLKLQEANSLTLHNGYALTMLVVTHPHDDHIEDIKNLMQLIPPAILYRQQYNWESIRVDQRGDYENLDVYSEWQMTYNQPAIYPQFGVDLLYDIYLSPAEAKRINESKFINNSSIPVILTYRGPQFTWKFLFAGDLEVDAWNALLTRPEFRNAIRGTNFFITAHHGHSSGYCKEIFDAFGSRPLVNIVSAHRKDQSVEPAYSDERNASGAKINGDARRMVSTRNDGSVFIEIDDTDRWGVYTKRLADNDPPAQMDAFRFLTQSILSRDQRR